MTRSVADAAIILSVIAGPDPRDNYTLVQPPVVPDYTKALNASALRGVRLGVPRRFFNYRNRLDEHIVAAFNSSLDTMRALGATVVDPADFVNHEELVVSTNESIVSTVDLKVCRAHTTEHCRSDQFHSMGLTSISPSSCTYRRV